MSPTSCDLSLTTGTRLSRWVTSNARTRSSVAVSGTEMTARVITSRTAVPERAIRSYSLTMPTMLPSASTTGAPLMRCSASDCAASWTDVSGLNVTGSAVITSTAVTGRCRSSSSSIFSSSSTNWSSSSTTPSVARAPVGAVRTQARNAGSRRNRSSSPAMCALARNASSASKADGAEEVPPCISTLCYIALTLPAFHSANPHLENEYDNMLACIRCGLCLTSCPTYVLSAHEAESPRGRVGMARALAEGHLDISPSLIEHELNCLVCDACSAVCPAGVHMDPLQVVLRAALERDQAPRRSLSERVIRWVVFGWLFMDMRRFRLVARLLWLYQRLGVRWLAQHSGVLKLMRLDSAERLLPPISGRFVVPKGEMYPAAQ